jgi:hypothetical protein
MAGRTDLSRAERGLNRRAAAPVVPTGARRAPATADRFITVGVSQYSRSKHERPIERRAAVATLSTAPRPRPRPATSRTWPARFARARAIPLRRAASDPAVVPRRRGRVWLLQPRPAGPARQRSGVGFGVTAPVSRTRDLVAALPFGGRVC